MKGKLMGKLKKFMISKRIREKEQWRRKGDKHNMKKTKKEVII